MSKLSLLIPSCVLVGAQLCADPIQTLTITSLTASQQAPPSGTVQFTASGPSVRIGGSEGIFARPFPIPIGVPIGFAGFTLPPNGDPNLMLGGFLTTTTPETALQLQGGAIISGTTSLVTPENGDVTFPGTVKGEYAAFACSLTQFPPHCTGPQIANIPIDLPGLITLSFNAEEFGPLGETTIQTASFTSIPEPSSALLLLLGAIAPITASIARRKTSI